MSREIFNEVDNQTRSIINRFTSKTGENLKSLAEVIALSRQDFSSQNKKLLHAGLRNNADARLALAIGIIEMNPMMVADSRNLQKLLVGELPNMSRKHLRLSIGLLSPIETLKDDEKRAVIAGGKHYLRGSRKVDASLLSSKMQQTIASHLDSVRNEINGISLSGEANYRGSERLPASRKRAPATVSPVSSEKTSSDGKSDRERPELGARNPKAAGSRSERSRERENVR